MVTNIFVVGALKETERINAHYGEVENDQESVENKNKKYIFGFNSAENFCPG